MMAVPRDRNPLHDALAPTPLRHENLILGVVEVFVDQPMPILQTHGVVLPNAEALFLTSADDVANEVSEQTPVVKRPLPRLHGVVVRATVEPHRKQALQRLLREKEH